MSLTIAEPSVTHSMFVIERVYPASPERVFRALSEPARKRKWFAEGEGFQVLTFDMDFRVGGAEVARFKAVAGPLPGAVFTNQTTYLDIEPGRRIVLAYTMANGDQRISASLATFDLVAAEKGGTKLVFTEQGAFFEGADGPKMREAGWRQLLESLGKALLDEQQGS